MCTYIPDVIKQNESEPANSDFYDIANLIKGKNPLFSIVLQNLLETAYISGTNQPIFTGFSAKYTT